MFPSIRRFHSLRTVTPASSRKLILASLDWSRPKDPPLSLGHASILANLRKHKVNVIEQSWSVNHKDFKASEVVDYILDQSTHANIDLAMGAFIWNEPYLQKILTTLKQEKFPGRIILGGPQISYAKSNLEKYYPQADVFIRGYGESALVQLLTAAQRQPVIAGVHYAGEPDSRTFC